MKPCPCLPSTREKVNPQQLKNALIDREESERVEKILAEGRMNAERFFSAIGRVASCRGSERARFAARLLHDLFCYHRDLRGLEAVTAGFDSINLVSDEKVRELSALNGMLYEFLPPEDQKPAEDRVLHHVILKADIRDSSRLDAFAHGKKHERRFILQPEFLRADQQTSCQVWSDQSVSGRRRHHRCAAGARRRSDVERRPNMRFSLGDRRACSASTTNFSSALGCRRWKWDLGLPFRTRLRST